ncbi:hypothetical protein ACEWY4_016287 [Coilia grayii]|uniref:Beta-galactoside alpha-2,6-sialyltransferase 1 n=1 Tax=Coilia grayii TaxID=363190 RepID=A0ABD1JKZ0_9TELE
MSSSVCFRASMGSRKWHLKQLGMLTWVLFLMVMFLFVHFTEVYDTSPLVPTHPLSRVKDSGAFQDDLGSLLDSHRAQRDIWEIVPKMRRKPQRSVKEHPDDVWSLRYVRQLRMGRRRRSAVSQRKLEAMRARGVVRQLVRGAYVSERMLSVRLRREVQRYIRENKHNVAFAGPRVPGRSREELLCQLKSQVVRWTLDGTEEPFYSRGWGGLVPNRTVEQVYGTALKTCAVVSSAGSILDSGLGKEIDSHDAVLRYNAAPTEGYEDDVGTKTTIRVMNSQILANPRYNFSGSELYKNNTLLAWDPAPYNVDLQEWYDYPDFDLFSAYEERRRHDPSQPFYILHPSYLWRLWDVIQGNTWEDIQPNPPSSGFIGIIVMMALCDKVDVYEYIPSKRQTDICHYYDYQPNQACTLGAYHPLLSEKALIRRMTSSSESDIGVKGQLTLPGLRSLQCSS